MEIHCLCRTFIILVFLDVYMKLSEKLHMLHCSAALVVLVYWHPSIAGLYWFVAVISNKGIVTVALGINEPIRTSTGGAVWNVTHLFKPLPSNSPLCGKAAINCLCHSHVQKYLQT